MNSILINITPFDWVVLISAMSVGVIGLGCLYKYKAAALFAQFCIVIGLQEVLIVEQSTAIYAAGVYFLLSSTYIITACIFAFLNSKYLTTTSIIAALYLTVVSFGALMGAEPLYYEAILGLLWIIQLVGGLSGVLNGYGLLNGIRSVISNIWSHVALRYHKGV